MKNILSNEIINAEEVVINEPIIVTEMVEHIGASLEDVEALREMCVEEFNKEMKEVEEMEMNRMNELKTKVDNGIKYAIISGKDKVQDEKFVTGKQVVAVFKFYKSLVGCEMSDTQKSYIKTLNSKQISNILYTLDVARKTLVAA